MFERGPFKKCPNPKCVGEDTLGILITEAGGRALTRRCTRCRHTVRELLPEIDKKVIYLDQFVVSELFKVKNGVRRQDALTPFWTEAHRRVQRALLLQQAVFPDSNIHLEETILFKDGTSCGCSTIRWAATSTLWRITTLNCISSGPSSTHF
jgi:hypothetical protein